MKYAALVILTAGVVTAGLRFLPFAVFNGKRETPEYITYLGKVLPYAIMAMLVVYCLRGISFSASPYGIPELVSTAVVVLAHVWKRSSILSIVSGTVCYMLLVQFVF